MPSTIYFIDYPDDFSEPCIDFKKGEQLLEIIRSDATLRIEADQDRRTVYFRFTDKWIQFFDLEKDGDIYLNYRVVAESPELYYKLVEIAEKLQTCLEVEGVLVYIPQYGLLNDPEDKEKSLPFELYGYELGEKMTQKPALIVRDAVNEIAKDKQHKNQQRKKLGTIKKRIEIQSKKRRKRNRIILFLIFLAAMVYFVFLN